MNAPLPPRPDLLPAASGTGRPTATWRWWEVVVAVLLAWLAGGVASLPLVALLKPDPGGPIGGGGLFIGIVSNAVTLVVLILWLRTAHPRWAEIIGWPHRSGVARELAVGAGLGIVFQVVVGIFSTTLVQVLGSLTGKDVAIPDQVQAGIRGWAVVAFFTYAVIAAPVTEEFIFRGLLFHSVADRHGFWPGAVASAIPFGLIHVVPGAAALGVWVLIVTMMGNGLAWAWIHWRRQNLLVNIAMHATFNLIGVIAIVGRVGP